MTNTKNKCSQLIHCRGVKMTTSEAKKHTHERVTERQSDISSYKFGNISNTYQIFGHSKKNQMNFFTFETNQEEKRNPIHENSGCAKYKKKNRKEVTIHRI